MKTKGITMGRFAVDIEIVNSGDMNDAEKGRLDPSKVRRKVVQGIVDTGATMMVLPEALVKELGIPDFKAKIRVKYGDGRRGLRREVGGFHLKLQGRAGIFTAIAEPKRDSALIGALVLETLDFLVDSKKLKLVPRDPEYIVNEIG